MPYPVIALPQILHILSIEVACLVASASDLVHVAGDGAEQPHQFLHTFHIQVDDIVSRMFSISYPPVLNRFASRGMSCIPIRATPPPAMSCFMPCDLAHYG